MHAILTNITIALNRRLASVWKFLPRASPRRRTNCSCTSLDSSEQ